MELPHNEPSKIKMETIRKRVDCRWLFRQFSRFRKATSLSNLLVNFCIDPAFSKWGFAIEAAQRSKQARSVLWITYPEIIGQHRFPYQEATYSAEAISNLIGYVAKPDSEIFAVKAGARKNSSSAILDCRLIVFGLLERFFPLMPCHVLGQT